VKLLLDECVDRRFAKELQGHFVKTVPQMGWATIKNGELLALAEKEFDVFITVDRNLSFQQNLSKFGYCCFGLARPIKPPGRFETACSQNPFFASDSDKGQG
jgi:hypothetical protein